MAAGTSSFGMSGVNAHLLLRQATGAVPPASDTQVELVKVVQGSGCRFWSHKSSRQPKAAAC